MSDSQFDAKQSVNQMETSREMLHLFARMAAFPIDVFILGMGIVIKAMQAMQCIASQGGDLVGDGESSNFIPKATVGEAGADAGGVLQDSSISKEQNKMADQDLSGSDTLKVVRYTIKFVKRDYEVILRDQDEVVDYDTDGASFGALMISRFMRSLGTEPRPARWRERETHYPPPAYRNGDFIGSIPDEDQKYIQFYFHVRERRQREPAEYDKDQVKALKEIRDEIGGLTRRIG